MPEVRSKLSCGQALNPEAVGKAQESKSYHVYMCMYIYIYTCIYLYLV